MINRRLLICLFAFIMLFFISLPALAEHNYSVETEGEDLIIKFENREYVRVHTRPDEYAPYIEKWYEPDIILRLTPGQWIEIKFENGQWYRATDADNR